MTETYTKRSSEYYGKVGKWETHYINEKITLHPDHSFEYKLSIALHNAPGPASYVYSFGKWFYKDGIFFLNSIQDTLEMTKHWREKQRNLYNPVYLYETLEPYKFKEMKDEKLYNHQDYMVSWTEDECQGIVMRYNSNRIEDFDDFLYSFLNDSTFRNNRIADCCVLIETMSPQSKIEAVITCPFGRDFAESHSPLPVEHIYNSLDETPYSPERLPEGYKVLKNKDILSVWKAQKYDCTFLSKDGDYLFSMTFIRGASMEWYVNWISKARY